MQTDPIPERPAVSPRSPSMTPTSPTTAASAKMDGAPARRRFRYVRDPRSAVLTPASLRLLEYVAAYQLVSLPQLVRLDVLSSKGTQRAMRTLFDAGLVEIVAAPRAALAEPGDTNDASLLFGSVPNIYSPTRAGTRLLDAHGLTVAQEAPPGYGPKNSLLLRHELGVRDVRIFLELAARQHPGQAVKTWHDGAEAVIDLGRTQLPRTVRPDAWFVHRLGEQDGRETVLVGLLEFDRATERGERRWSEKLIAYRSLFFGPRLQDVTGYVKARVLVVCPDHRRRGQLADLIAEKAEPLLAQRFWLAARAGLDAPDLTLPVWQRPGRQALLPLVPSALLTSGS